MKSIRIAVTFAALITTACSGGSASPTTSAPGAEASTAASPPSVTASPTQPATASALPEGTYQTAPIPTQTTLKAAAEAAGFTWDAARWQETTTVYAIRLENGHLYWFGSADGAPLALASSGTYEVTDDHTVAYADAEDPSSTFILTFTLDGDLLTTHVDPDPPDCGIECVIFFNSAPFVRQP